MLDKFFSFFSSDIGIDLGTANTLVLVKGKGIVVREPSIIARHKKTKEIISIGGEAKKMLGKTPLTIETIRPLRSGVIADYDGAVAMISYYIKEINGKGNPASNLLIRPRVVIGIPSAITEVQRRAVWEAALTAGARQAYLIEEPMAAAIGQGVSVFSPTGVMVVDIGGGTTEIAVISLGGIVVSKSLKIAGDELDIAIIHYVRLRHGLLLGEKTAEDIKIKIGSAYANEKQKPKTKEEEDIQSAMIVRGRDLETGLPKSVRLSAADVREALAPILAQIIEAVADVLEDAPPELTADILEHGILLTGGGANLRGLDSLIVERTHIPVIIADDPLTTVVRGAGKVLENDELLNRVKVTGGLK